MVSASFALMLSAAFVDFLGAIAAGVCPSVLACRDAEVRLFANLCRNSVLCNARTYAKTSRCNHASGMSFVAEHRLFPLHPAVMCLIRATHSLAIATPASLSGPAPN